MDVANVLTSHTQLQGVLPDQHHSEVHTHDKHTDVTEYKWFGPNEAGNAGAAIPVGTRPARDAIYSWAEAADNDAIWYWHVPAGYVSGLVFAAWWYTLGGVASGNYSCRLNMCQMALGNATGTTGTTTTIMIPERNDNLIGVIPITAPITALVAGDLYRIAFSRLGSTDAAGDTATQIMRFIGLSASWLNNN